MKLKLTASLIMFVMPFSLFADQSLYCPQNHAYINIGMTPDQVIAACGQPISQNDSNRPILQKIPVQQLIYNNQGANTAFYGVWNLPTGSGGTSLQINVVNNLVKDVSVNGSDSNAFSLCGGNTIEVGDEVGKIYSACGSPDVVNNTYINQMVRTAQRPVVWVYQPGQYQSPVSLTFVDGKLQSINN
jgi:hypothetical protein